MVDDIQKTINGKILEAMESLNDRIDNVVKKIMIMENQIKELQQWVA